MSEEPDLKIKSIRKRIVIYSLMMLFASSILCSGIVIYFFQDVLYQSEENKISDTAVSSAKSVEEVLKRFTSIAKQVASRTKARNILEDYVKGKSDLEITHKNLSPILNDALEGSTEIVGITRYDLNKTKIVSVGRAIPNNVSFIGMEEPVGESIHISINKINYILVRVVIKNKKVETLGEDLVLFSTDSVISLVQKINKVVGGDTHLVKVGDKQVINLDGYSEISDKKPLLDLDYKQVSHKVIQSENNILVIRKINGVPWILTYSEPKSVVDDIVMGKVVPIAITIIIASLIGGIVLLMILKPLSNKIIVKTDELEGIVYNRTKELTKFTERQKEYIKIISEKEQAALFSQKTLENVLLHIPNQIFWKDKDLNYLGCSQTFANVIGLEEPKEILGKTDYDFQRDATHAESYREWDRKIMDSGEAVIDLEEKFHTVDGEEGVVLTSKVPLRDVSGKVYGILGICTDITDRVKLQKSFEEANERYNLAIEGVGVGVWDWFNVNEPKLYWNDQFKALLGYSPDELDVVIDTFSDALHPEDKERTWKAVQDHWDGLAPYDTEYRLKCKNGDYKWFRAMGKVTYDKEGEPLRMVGSVEDIHDRKLAEQNLKVINERFNLAIESVGIGIWDWDVKANVTRWNHQMFEIYEMDFIESMPYEQWSNTLHPDDTEKVQSELMTILETKRKTSHAPFRIIVPDGNVKYIEAYELPVIENDDVVRVIGVNIDVTEKSLAENFLAEANARYNLVIEGVGVGIWDGEIGQTDFYSSDRFKELLGYKSDEINLNTDKFNELIHSEDKDKTWKAVQDHLESKVPYDVEYRLKCKNDEYKWFRAMGKATFNKEGKPLRMVGSVEDINDRKIAEEKNKKLLEVFDISTDFIAQITPDKKVVYANKAFKKMVGIEDVEGMTVDQWHSQEQMTIIENEIIPEIIQKGSWRGENIILNYAKEEIPCLFQGLAHKNEQGDIELLTGIFREISELKKIQNDLRDNQNLFNMAMDAGKLGWWKWSIAENKVIWSEQEENIFGFKMDDSADPFAWAELIHPEDSERVYGEINTAVKEKSKDITFIYRIYTKDTSEMKWLYNKGTLELNEEEQPISMIGVTIDITEMKKVEEELRRSNQDLDDFAFIASHDLKEPLRGIQQHVSFLQHDLGEDLNEKADERIGKLIGSTERLKSLIDDLLKYSRLNRQESAIQKVDVNQIIKGICIDLESYFEEHNVRLDIPKSLLDKVYVDKVKLTEIFRNLIVNAIKYNENDEKLIEIGMTFENGKTLFYVKDNGIGIDSKHHENIFKMFKRLHTRDKFGGGTGSGLALVKKLIESQGGEIMLESEKGLGSTFKFYMGA